MPTLEEINDAMLTNKQRYNLEMYGEMNPTSRYALITIVDASLINQGSKFRKVSLVLGNEPYDEALKNRRDISTLQWDSILEMLTEEEKSRGLRNSLSVRKGALMAPLTTLSFRIKSGHIPFHHTCYRFGDLKKFIIKDSIEVNVAPLS